jgi:hypothetical protein
MRSPDSENSESPLNLLRPTSPYTLSCKLAHSYFAPPLIKRKEVAMKQKFRYLLLVAILGLSLLLSGCGFKMVCVTSRIPECMPQWVP